MSQAQRLNKVIELLEQGKVVFGAVNFGGDAAAYSDLGYDFVIFELEHQVYDMPKFSASLQSLLDRKKIAAKGSLQPDTVPFIRVPPNARELNQWVIKQALDTGVYGLIVPHLDSVEQARAIVQASRYPQAAGAQDREPAGQRGWIGGASRYWGVSVPEYTAAADLWPLDPKGELFFMPMIEGIDGVKNLSEILSAVKGIGAVWAGSGDLSMEMGLSGNMADPRVEEQMIHVLKICKQHGVACASVAFSPQEAEQRIEQGFQIIVTIPRLADPIFEAGKKRAGR